MVMTATCILDAKATLGEGPLWDPRRDHLWWVDITAGELHAYHPTPDRDSCIEVGEMVGAVGLRRDGGLVAALEGGFALLDLASGIERLEDPERDRPETRFNDGKCDPGGRFWAGTMARDEAPEQGSLYCLEPDGTVEPKVSGVTISNGLAWDEEAGLMYYVDSPTQCVFVFDYDIETGAISDRRVAVRVPKDVGTPDGMTIDAEGMLWIAHWGGANVSRWNPSTGERLLTVQVPATQVSSCAFGGADHDQLFITTARKGLPDEALTNQPQAGGLFRVEPGVRGGPAYLFDG